MLFWRSKQRDHTTLIITEILYGGSAVQYAKNLADVGSDKVRLTIEANASSTGAVEVHSSYCVNYSNKIPFGIDS